MRASKITGIGGYIPKRKVTNFDLEKLLDTNDEWIDQRTGIKSRHWADAQESTSDLALNACLLAINHAGINKTDIDMIVFATSSPDSDIPGSACFLQAKLGLSGIPYFDIRQACSGFIYGLSLADQFIKTGFAKCVLLVGAELQSKGLDQTPNGRNMSVLFGDGAGAVVVQATEIKDPTKDAHVLTTHLHADGSFAKELWMPGPGSMFGERRVTHEMLDNGLQYPQMNGRLVFGHAVTRMPEVLLEACNKAKIDVKDLDIFFFHQANLRINAKVAEILEIPEDKVHSTIQKFGNTTAATIPLGMYDAFTEGKLKPGMRLGLAAFGAGFTWSSAIINF